MFLNLRNLRIKTILLIGKLMPTEMIAKELAEAGRVWNQGGIPVILRRTGRGQRLRLRLPYSAANRTWLSQLGKTSPDWNSAGKFWEFPKSWFNKFVDEALRKFGKLYVIQPFVEHEICAPACRNAVGHECQCSCMGANHGTADGAGWFDITEAFAIRIKESRLACRLMRTKSSFGPGGL